MKKKLRNFGFLGITTTMVVPLISCSSTEKKTNKELLFLDNTVTLNKISKVIHNLNSVIISSKSHHELKSTLSNLKVNDVVDYSLLGFPNSYLNQINGMTILCTINKEYNNSTNSADVNVKISSKTNNDLFAIKIITIKAKYDFSADLEKFHDTQSTKTLDILNNDVISLNPTAEQLGISNPVLSLGTIATFSILSTKFSSKDPKQILVTLKHDSDIVTKTFILEPYKSSTFDFTNDVNQFIDFISRKTAVQLNSDNYTLNPIPDQLGFDEPLLSHGTIAKYTIDSTLFFNEQSKEVRVTLTHGIQSVTKVFHLTPKFDFYHDLSKFINVVSTKTPTTLNNDVTTTQPTATQLGYTEHRLTHGTTATYSINELGFTSTSKEITVTLHHGNLSAKKTFRLTPLHDFTNDLVQFNDITSSKTVAQLNYDVTNTHPTANCLGIPEPSLETGVRAIYKIESRTFNGNPKKITLILKYNNRTARKEFYLTPIAAKYDFTHDLAKFNDVTSSKTATELSYDTISVHPTANCLGIPEPSLSDDVIATYTIQSMFFNSYRKKIILTLTHGVETARKEFYLTPIAAKYDFTHDLAKFNDVTSSKTARELKLDVTSVNPTADQLGISEPSLSKDVHVSYEIRSVFFYNNMSKELKITLMHDSEYIIKTIILMPKIYYKEQRQRFLSQLVLPDENILISSLTDSNNFSDYTYAQMKSIFDMAQKKAISNDEGELENAIDEAQKAISNVNKYNQKVLELNNGLKLVGDYKNLISGSDINSIISDGHGGLWVAGDSGKLDHIGSNGKQISGWTTKVLLNGLNINSIISDGHGGLWVAGDSGKLDHIDANGNKILETQSLLNNFSIYSMVLDGHGGLWVAGGGGLIGSGLVQHITFSDERLTIHPVKKLWDSGPINSIVLDNNKNIWIGGVSGKVLHLGSDGIPIGNILSAMDSGYISTMTLDEHGGLWVGGAVGKLDYISSQFNSISSNLESHAFLDSQTVHSIMLDGHGGLWVAGDSGKLDHIDSNGNIISNSWTTKTLLDGSNINSITSDEHGGLWVAGDNGKLIHLIYVVT